MTIFSFSYNILRVILVQEYNLSFFWCTKFALMWIASSDASSCEFYQVYSYLSPDFIRVNTMMPHACIFEVSAILFDWVSAHSYAFITNSISWSRCLSKHFNCPKPTQDRGLVRLDYGVVELAVEKDTA
jgi:hypothetical protein